MRYEHTDDSGCKVVVTTGGVATITTATGLHSWRGTIRLNRFSSVGDAHRNALVEVGDDDPGVLIPWTDWDAQPWLQPEESTHTLASVVPGQSEKQRPRFSTIPTGPLVEIAQILTDGLTSGDDPTKKRGLWGWREMQAEDPGGTEMTYYDSLMRHVMNGEWAKVAVNAIILADLEDNEEK